MDTEIFFATKTDDTHYRVDLGTGEASNEPRELSSIVSDIFNRLHDQTGPKKKTARLFIEENGQQSEISMTFKHS